ncbi:MAG: glycine cleavage system protein R [Xanthomonadales bacterium]|nr:glycine cleavage system protein R [Xanthomonadales bacterium]
MNNSIVLTVIANDQPGVIQAVSKVLRNHDGNWTQSSMSTLAGQFAGILLVYVPNDKTEACLAELHGLESEGLRIIAHVSDEEPAKAKTHEYMLELVGNDRPGIVHDITVLLAGHNVNVRDLETVVESASMGGGELFKASAQLVVPETTDIDDLAGELEDIANDLMVDIRFEK